jgi:hypothetical protein
VIPFTVVLLAVLINLTTQISHGQISPAEVLVVLTILNTNTNTIVNLSLLALGVGDFRGNGIGYLLNLSCSAWLQILLLWFWVKGRTVLPLLDTSNHTWLFVRVLIDGWFRIFSSAWVSFSVLCLLPMLRVGLVFVGYSTKWWRRHQAESDIWVSFDPLDLPSPHSTRTSKFRVERERNSLSARQFVPRWSIRRIGWTHWKFSALALPMLIAMVEMTIRYNGLQRRMT